MKMPGSLDPNEGGFADKAGTYHVSVTHVDPHPVNKENKLMNAVGFEFAILDGTESDQKKKKLQTNFQHPDESHKDGGEFCGRMEARLLRALGVAPTIDGDAGDWDDLATLAKRHPGQDLDDPDWDSLAEGLKGAQLVVKVKQEKGSSGGLFYKVDGAHLYRVTDPEVADVPKDKAALKAIGVVVPTGKAASKPAASPAAKPQQQAKQTAAAATSSNGGGGGGGCEDFNLDDL